jgi:hypothetical protein
MGMKTRLIETWVVFKMKFAGGLGPNAVCDQAEWEEMERLNPGRNTLVLSGITSEPEAERLARSGPGGTAPKGVTLKAR